jgi:hypothetical protein
LAAFTKQTKLALGKFNLRGLTVNNNARKKELVRILCTATAHIAELGPHDLVAGFLLQHHDAFLATRTTLQCFCQRYRSYNNCAHAQESAGALYDLRFGTAAANSQQSPTAAAQLAAGVSSRLYRLQTARESALFSLMELHVDPPLHA